jgi:imidazolonepropionase-like amidohydrolase
LSCLRRCLAVGLVAAVCILAAPLPAAAQEASVVRARWVVLHAGALLANPGRAPVSEATVVVADGRIVDVRAGYVEAADLPDAAGAEVETIDLRDSFVLPGLIDAHTHITSEYSAGIRLERLQRSDADSALLGVEYARRTLLAGFTTVRNVGSSGDAAFALRDAIRHGIVPGPRMLVAGESITPTGGHSDATLGYRPGLFDLPGAIDGICDGSASCRRAVRAQIKRGADLIKLTATGGVLSNTSAGTEQQFFEDELEAIVKTGHLLGRKVAAHAHGTQGINAALRAGVDSIEHGTYLDAESVRLFVQTGAFLVPTVLAGKTVEERARIAGYYPPPVVKKALEVGPTIQAALARAHKGGVRIAFGTDSGVSSHGENAREFVYMVEAGMNEMEVIVAATTAGAELLGLSDRIGTLEPGKLADLIATERNPLIDITELQRVSFVMKGGVIHSR